MSLQQAQAEGLTLHFPENLGKHDTVPMETALNMLLRAVGMAQNLPFRWQYIDKPIEGALVLVFLMNPTQFPNDGIRWQEPETSLTTHVGAGRELELSETKSGFIPGSQDHNAWRVRRRYRLIRGGHPALVLVHYTRSPQPQPIMPQFASQPVRSYPLRQVTEPAVFVMGDKQGQKVFPPNAGGMHGGPGGPSAMGGGPMGGMGVGGPMPGGGPMQGGNPGFPHSAQAAALINRNNAMEQLERRREREREKERAAAAARGRSDSTGRPHVEEASDDETEMISLRALALTRYKRNHDLMSEVFTQAAYGEKAQSAQKSPYSIFDKDDLDSRVAKLQEDVDRLKQTSDQRRIEKDSSGITA